MVTQAVGNVTSINVMSLNEELKYRSVFIMN